MPSLHARVLFRQKKNPPTSRFLSPAENGVLSFENPNYTLGGSNDPRLDDALNSNNSNGSATHDPPLDGGLAALGKGMQLRLLVSRNMGV